MKVLTKRGIESARNDAKKAVEVLRETRRKIFRAYGTEWARTNLDWAIGDLEHFDKELGSIKAPTNSRKLRRMEEQERRQGCR